MDIWMSYLLYHLSISNPMSAYVNGYINIVPGCMTSVFCHKVMSTVLISQYQDESMHLEFEWERNLAEINKNSYCYRSRNNPCWWCNFQHSGGIWCIHVVCWIYLWNVCNNVQNYTVTWSRISPFLIFITMKNQLITSSYASFSNYSLFYKTT